MLFCQDRGSSLSAYSHGVTNDDILGQGDGSSIHSNKSAGIFMSNASQMVYALGATGEKRARETLRSEFGTLAEDGIFGGVSMNKISSSDITMLNVGISGFKRVFMQQTTLLLIVKPW